MSGFKQLASTEEINAKIDEMAAAIIRDYEGTQPLFVALLRGAAPFASKLMFAIARQNENFHPELDYMMVRTYGTSTTAGEPEIVTDLSPSTTVEGRDVIVLDDVLDKGITADFVFSHLKKRAPRSIKLAVLGDKKTPRHVDFSADYTAFEFDDVWLVGMGMDNAATAREGYRWSETIWAVEE